MRDVNSLDLNQVPHFPNIGQSQDHFLGQLFEEKRRDGTIDRHHAGRGFEQKLFQQPVAARPECSQNSVV